MTEETEGLNPPTDEVKRFWWSTYKDYYNTDATKKWMSDSAKTLSERCKDARFDWQEYDSDRLFVSLEEVVAQNLFGVNEKLAQRAVTANNVLAGYNSSQRRTAIKVRQKLEKIGKYEKTVDGQTKTVIETQVVPFLLLADDDIRAGQSNARSGCVFRVKCKDDLEKTMFVDGSARTYKSWDYFLTSNSIPMAIMCYTPDGFLKGDKDGTKRAYKIDEMKFCETPACSVENRSLSWISTGCAWLSPVAAIGLFWTPAGWIGMGLQAITAFVTSYSFISQGCTIYDKYNHDESYLVDVFHFISTIGTLAIQKALPKYLKSVVKARRKLTKLEHIVITAFLCGMSGSQVLSLIGMIYSIATKEGRTTALDVLNLVVACQNMYCCIISPKTAAGMLEQVKAELANEEIKKMNKINVEQAKGAKLKGEISELERRAAHPREGDNVREIRKKIEEKQKLLKTCTKAQQRYQEEFQANKSPELEKAYEKKKELDKLQKEFNNLERRLQKLNGNGPEAERIRTQMQSKKTACNAYEQEIIKYQEKHQDAVRASMENTGAKEKYQEFLDNGRNSENPRQRIDQNGRIVQAMCEMDAELVFKTAAETQSKIQFSNGETLDLAINNDFDIHPRSIQQMTSINEQGQLNTETDLKKVFTLTKNPPDDYLTQINQVLQPYRMITRTEIGHFKTQMRNALGMPDEVESRFDNLSAPEAFRLRTVMSDFLKTNKQIRRHVTQAALKLAEQLHYSSDSFRLADCVEIIKLEANKQSHQLQCKTKTIKAKIGTITDKNAALGKKFKEEQLATDDEIETLKSRYFSSRAIKELCYKRIANNDSVDLLAKTVEDRMRILEERFFGDDFTLPMSHPLSAVYHIMKHGKDVDPNGNMTSDQQDLAYLDTVPKEFFGISTNLQNTSISQNGMTIDTVWKSRSNYFGVTGAPYTYSDDPYTPNHVDNTTERYIKKVAKKIPNPYTIGQNSQRLSGERVKTHYHKK